VSCHQQFGYVLQSATESGCAGASVSPTFAAPFLVREAGSALLVADIADRHSVLRA